MKSFLTLDKKGITVALVFAVFIVLLGRAEGPYLLAVLIFFLILSALVTNIGKRRKKAVGVYERSRGWKNVLANGAMPVLITAFYFLNSYWHIFPQAMLIVGYLASVSAVTADKFASEIGVLDGKPLILVTLKRAKQGTSGGVSTLGLGAGLLASLLIALTIVFYTFSFEWLVIVILAGFIGNIADSIFGYFEEKGFGSKFTTNFICSFVGFLVGIALFAI